MSDPRSMPASIPTPPLPGSERRKNAALRDLVDEMLASIRTATRNELWSDHERAQYEKELAEIMARVRLETMRR
jgi:hypothetical protein